MERSAEVRPMGPRGYAAIVHEGAETTHHRVTGVEALLEEMSGVELLDETHQQEVVEQAIAVLLDETPATSLPHDIDLTAMPDTHAGFLPELRARLMR